MNKKTSLVKDVALAAIAGNLLAATFIGLSHTAVFWGEAMTKLAETYSFNDPKSGVAVALHAICTAVVVASTIENRKIEADNQKLASNIKTK